ncbi:MAG: nucleotide sugar dehydrogenase [Verrucomicrobia bacterium]|nr:nucleotide sugar dehydrogenase [Verrucomicrobiota bacterium]
MNLTPTSTIGIVGLGYVGLPLALGYAAKGYQALGFDIDQSKIDHLRAGRSYIKHIPGDQVAAASASKKLDATTDFSRIGECAAVILCVPTPLDEHFEPDLTFVTDTLDAVVPHMVAGQTISLESTTYPGTTEEEVVTRVEAAGFKVGESVYVVYSPEREDPGNPKFSATNIPKVVGGHTAACLEAGVALYGAAFDQVVPVSSTQVAEMSKLLENIYRSINIGLVNELKIVADRMGIDIWEVIRAASTKPFGFTPFYPGPGLGGHCIPIDPFYLTWKAREYGVHTRFIELAGQINRAMPQYVVERTMIALNSRGKAVKGSRILLMGLAYKANVDDMRESPTFALLDLFDELGAEVTYHDPHVPVVGPTREHQKWAGKQSAACTAEVLSAQDAVVIATHHAAFDLPLLASHADLIIDTRNAMSGVTTRPGQVVKA